MNERQAHSWQSIVNQSSLHGEKNTVAAGKGEARDRELVTIPRTESRGGIADA